MNANQPREEPSEPYFGDNNHCIQRRIFYVGRMFCLALTFLYLHDTARAEELILKCKVAFGIGDIPDELYVDIKDTTAIVKVIRTMQNGQSYVYDNFSVAASVGSTRIFYERKDNIAVRTVEIDRTTGSYSESVTYSDNSTSSQSGTCDKQDKPKTVL